MRNDRYTTYLKSSKWQQRRLAKLEQANYQCGRKDCHERDRLSVHHLTYERLGNERSDDLIVLCQSCHWAADEFRKSNTEVPDTLSAPHENSAEKKLENKQRKAKPRQQQYNRHGKPIDWNQQKQTPADNEDSHDKEVTHDLRASQNRTENQYP